MWRKKPIFVVLQTFNGMKTGILSAVSSVILMLAVSCEGNQYGPTGHRPGQEKPEQGTEETGFVKGADISWVTQMEKDGEKFYTADGKETDSMPYVSAYGSVLKEDGAERTMYSSRQSVRMTSG